MASDPVEHNRGVWNATSDAYQELHGDMLSDTAQAWGVWRIPEAEVQALGDVSGCDVLEFGCGAAQWSIALAQRGARAVGLDVSGRQLQHARRLSQSVGLDLPLVLASVHQVPLANASFDVVFCDHGGLTFAPPEAAVAEAARVLRPGGRLVFCMSTPLRDVCWDQDNDRLETQLLGNYFELHEIWDEDTYCYQLPYGDWIRLFRRHGLLIDDLIEVRPPPGATTSYEGFTTLEWARRWPAEHIWKLSRTP